MSAPLRIRYRFDLPDGSQKTLDLQFDATTFRLSNPLPAEPPFWTELKFNQCANCPLSTERHAHCPAAVQMAAALEPLNALVSFDTVGVTVVQPERTVHVETTAQQAMSSLLGLIMATAGCPWTDRLRPMARFHLPFANEAETLYRSVSMFLLSLELAGRGPTQAVAEASGAAQAPRIAEPQTIAEPASIAEPPSVAVPASIAEPHPAALSDTAGAPLARGTFAALEQLYENLHVVNRDMSRRLGAATNTDPARNAIALLDTYTTLLPAALDRSLDELRPLFDAWQSK
jgi:hypothetical protein